MKKRLVSIIVVMILLISILSGCGLITLNAERDGAEVVSTVNIDGWKGVVTKSELLGFFNQVGYLYIQYYGWPAEKVINEFVTQLSNKEVLVLVAMRDIANAKGVDIETVKVANNAYVDNMLKVGTNKYDKTIRQYDLFNLFDNGEKVFVTKQTNKTFEQGYDALVKEVKAEFEANKQDEAKPEEDTKPEEDKKDELAPRTQKTLTPATTYDKKITYTDEETAKILSETFFTKMDKKLADGELNEVEKEAYKRFKENLIKSYDDIDTAWNSMLDSQKEARLLEKYREEYQEKFKASKEEIKARYEFKLSTDINKITDEASYKAAIEADKTNDTLVHINKDDNTYFQVKSILLQFNDDQKKALEAIKGGVLGTGTDNKQAIADARDELATNNGDVDLGIYSDMAGIKVNVSNPNYDPEAKCTVKDCPCHDCDNYTGEDKSKCDVDNCPCEACVNHAYTRKDQDFKTILDEMSIALALKTKDGDAYIDSVVSVDGTELTADAKLNAKMDVFDDYIYMVNDDTGMFNSTGYYMTTKGASQYVAEYVALGRELVKNAKDNNTSAVGMVGGIGETSVANPFVKEGEEDTEATIKIHSYQAVDANGTPIGEKINYIVNDFGIHIIMVTYVADEGVDTTIVNKDEEKGDQYVLNLTDGRIVNRKNIYVTDDKGRVVLNDKGQKQLREVENKTIYDKLYDTITTEKRNEAYAEFEKITTDNNKANIVREDKVINKIIKDIEKALGDQGHGHEGHNH